MLLLNGLLLLDILVGLSLLKRNDETEIRATEIVEVMLNNFDSFHCYQNIIAEFYVIHRLMLLFDWNIVYSSFVAIQFQAIGQRIKMYLMPVQ